MMWSSKGVGIERSGGKEGEAGRCEKGRAECD